MVIHNYEIRANFISVLFVKSHRTLSQFIYWMLCESSKQQNSFKSGSDGK